MIRKGIILTFVLLLVLSCKTSKQENEVSFYVGTYTDSLSKGIYKYCVSDSGKLSKIGLVAKATNPSFLVKTKDRKLLLAVEEVNKDGAGFVSAFKIEKDSLLFINKTKTGGAHPCFVTVNNENQVLVANYTGGNIGYLKVDTINGLTNLLALQQHVGKGTTNRQKAPHAHSVWFKQHTKEIISVDLGTNELWFSTLDSSKINFVPLKQTKLKMTDGAGPRHLAFHPKNTNIYVLNELNNTISLLNEKEGVYSIVSSISTLPENFINFSKAADIHISKDGQFLYASNRGHNSIVIFKVNAVNGTLELIDFTSVKGESPRNFNLTPDNRFLIVANQNSNSIVCFQRNVKTGKLTFISEISAPTPVCILF